MSKVIKHKNKQDFITLFNSIARHKHRYSVFSDFVHMSAFAVHNAIFMNESLEKEYLQIVSHYTKDEANSFSELLSIFIELLNVEPRDILGTLYMELELENSNNGQFFTPHDISLLLAKMNYDQELENFNKPFITLSEPACGAGGMVLAFANEMIKRNINPGEKLWVQCIDIDRLAGLMCYLQLSLWYIPAEIIIGNTLTLNFREVYYTPAHYLGNWDAKLKTHRSVEKLRNFIRKVEGIDSDDKKQEIIKSHESTTASDLHDVLTQTKTDEKNDKQVYVQQDLFEF